MKLLSILFIAVGVFASSQALAHPIGPAGCGLGHLVFGGKDMQILAATTNGSFYNQIFGITTGSLECDAGGRETAMLTYIQNNKLAIEKDIARGQGDSLGALAQISGCEDSAQLNEALRSNYSQIFPTAEPAAAQVTDSIKKVIRENPTLKTTCRLS